MRQTTASEVFASTEHKAQSGDGHQWSWTGCLRDTWLYSCLRRTGQMHFACSICSKSGVMIMSLGTDRVSRVVRRWTCFC